MHAGAWFTVMRHETIPGGTSCCEESQSISETRSPGTSRWSGTPSFFVGWKVELGELTVTVQSKIPNAPFLRLLRYAYGLRQLSLENEAQYDAKQDTFQDLIARQLAAEVEELIARGLHRDYLRDSAELAVPRGRIAFQRYVLAAGGSRASLPCVYYPRSHDTILNRVLLAGFC